MVEDDIIKTKIFKVNKVIPLYQKECTAGVHLT